MKILFVCRLNINRSQIVAAIFNKTSKKNHATSAGIATKIKDVGTMLKEARLNPIIPMKEYGYDLSHKRRRRLNRRMAEQADRIVLIFSKKKYAGTLPSYLEKATNVEWWDISSISDNTPFDEYRRLERKRIKKIKSLVEGLAGKVGK